MFPGSAADLFISNMGLRASRSSFVCLFVVLCVASQVNSDAIGAEPRLWPWDKFCEMMETMMDDMTQVIMEGLHRTLYVLLDFSVFHFLACRK